MRRNFTSNLSEKRGRIHAVARCGLLRLMAVAAAAVSAAPAAHASLSQVVTANWNGATANWTTAADWSSNPNYPNNGTPAGTDYQANITAGGGGSGYVVTLNSDIALAGLTIGNANATLNQTSGTLTATQVDLSSGQYNIGSGGTLSAAVTVANSAALSVAGTINGDTLSLFGTSAKANVYFGANETFASGTIDFLSSSFGATVSAGAGSAGTLTLGAGALVEGGDGTLGDLYTSTLINNGTIDANLSGAGLIIQNNAFANNGAAEATNGGKLLINAAGWSNVGTITAAANSTVILGGSFTTADIGSVNGSAGRVTVAGTLNNSNSTLTLNSTTGSWLLSGGVINNGTLALTNGQSLNADDGTINGVAVTGGDVNVNGGYTLTIKNGINLNGNAINLNANNAVGISTLLFNGTQTFHDGTINLGAQAIAVVGGSTLTLGSRAVVLGGSGTIGDQGAASTLINNGTINANVSNPFSNPMQITNGVFTNNGTAEASNGAVLAIAGPGNGGAWVNNGVLALDSNARSVIKTVSGLEFAKGSALDIVLGANGSAGQLHVDGNLTIDAGDPALNISQLAGTSFTGKYLIATYTGTLSGMFGVVTPGYTVSYATPGDIYITSYATPIPEPATLGLLVVGCLALVKRRRREAQPFATIRGAGMSSAARAVQ